MSQALCQGYGTEQEGQGMGPGMEPIFQCKPTCYCIVYSCKNARRNLNININKYKIKTPKDKNHVIVLLAGFLFLGTQNNGVSCNCLPLRADKIQHFIHSD